MPAVATAGGLPTRLGKYEIMMPLAAGGMARIYIGRSTGIGSFERHVVLKLITPERANDETAVQMFLDEARLAASLNHQNVAQVFEVGEDAGIHYLAMEYVHGQDLRALLAKAGSQGTRVPLELALTVVAGAAAGLHHAHERRGADGMPLGIVHRDVSPSNIMVGYDGAVKLLDFGIAKAAARSIETQSGIIKGKFAYMAPEQCRGREVDCRSDVFSLGIILYEISTQHRCFRADSDFDTMHRIVTGDVVHPSRIVPGYPPALEEIVLRALAVDPDQRYQSAGLLLEAIESFAVSSRMSLSTMSLGRFMREMFGDQSEPWLTNSARHVAPLKPRESTISNTNGSGSEPMGSRERALAPAPAPSTSPSSSSSARLQVASTRGSGPMVALPPAPLPAPPVSFTAAPGSGTGRAMPLSGYPSAANELSYPRYEPPPGALDEDVRLSPNRRPLFIGLGIATFGLAILLAMTLGGSDDGLTEQPIVMEQETTAPAPAVAVAAATEPKTEPKTERTVEPQPALAAANSEPLPRDHGVAPSESAPHDEVVEPTTITLEVTSVPSGAEVLLAGKVIGTTPLELTRPRGKGQTTIAIRKAGYADTTTKIDLGEDFTSEVTLKKVEPPKPPPRRTPPPRKERPRNTDAAPKKPSCQRPELYNPLDDRPVCSS